MIVIWEKKEGNEGLLIVIVFVEKVNKVLD